MQSGRVLNIQRYAIHDGPGIRTTVFLQGCPLRCWWCHNPESQPDEPAIAVVESRCIRCNLCWEVCPLCRAAGEAAVGNGKPNCTLCGACVAACPTAARQMIGRPMSVDDVLAAILEDRIFYDQSGGGVTFSGGEPLAQPLFLENLLKACRAAGVHTAVDTCGHASEETLLAVARYTDLFLYDLKLIDPQRHAAQTGQSNRQILANLAILSRMGAAIWLRVPLVPGVNDDTESLAALARAAAATAGVSQVNVLPYHALGVHKSRRQTLDGGETVGPLSTATVAAAAHYFQAAGLRVYTGG